MSTSNLELSSKTHAILTPSPPVHANTVPRYCTDEISSKAWQVAALTKNLDQLLFLLRGDFTPDAHRALLLALRLRNLDFVHLILQKLQSHENNYVDEHWVSPLHYAIHHNSSGTVASLLIRHGTNAHEIDDDGHSPLSDAIDNGYEDCVLVFLECSESRAPSNELEFSDQVLFHADKHLVVEFQWEVPCVFEEVWEEFPGTNPRESMLDLVTVYDCCTCGGYLSKNWPGFGVSLFKLLIERIVGEKYYMHEILVVNEEEIDVHLWQRTRENST